MHVSRRAFTLIELLVVIAIIAVLIAILLPAFGEARRNGKLTIDASSLRQLSVASASYAVDYENRIPAFTWKENEAYLMMNIQGHIEKTNTHPWNIDAAGEQAIDIIRRRADRVGPTGFPMQKGWIPHPMYSYLILVDYMAGTVPDPIVVSAGDETRDNWRIDPFEKFDKGFWLPLQPEVWNPVLKRWPYSSSFQMVPASYEPYQSVINADTNLRWWQGSLIHEHEQYSVNFKTRLGNLSFADVSHPGAKVFMMDTHQRHFGTQQIYFGHMDARVPLAFFDGSVGVKRTSDANPGWVGKNPDVDCPVFKYQPDTWEPPTRSGDEYDEVVGAYRWTRGGLKGIDFGGKPLETGQSDPGNCDL